MSWRFRWSLKEMMVLVAIVAVFARWPILAFPVLFLAIVLGGPVVGGWAYGRRGPDRVVEGGVTGGAVSYALLGGLFGLAVGVGAGHSSLFIPGLLLVSSLYLLCGALLGAVLGTLIGAVVGVALSPLSAIFQPGPGAVPTDAMEGPEGARLDFRAGSRDDGEVSPEPSGDGPGIARSRGIRSTGSSRTGPTT